MSVSQDLIVMPGTGEVVYLGDENEVASALDAIEALVSQLAEAKRAVADRAITLSQEKLTKTITLADSRKLTLTSGEATEYDADEIRAELVEAGIEEKVIDGIVVQQPVVYKVNAARAKSASAANPKVKAIIDRHTRKVPRTVYASVKP